MCRIGFLGAGKMAQALAKGFIQSGITQAEKIIASCPSWDKESITAFQNLGMKVTDKNEEIPSNVEVIIMAVKPCVVPYVLTDIRQCLASQHLLLSIAMGISLQFLQGNLPKGSRVVRVMSNTPAIVGKGASVFSKGTHATVQDGELTRNLLMGVGTCDEVPENILDVVTALSGSGPAYIYVMIEALADGAVRMGMSRALAYKLAAQTIAGAAEMVLQMNEHPAKLKDDVASPAGSTAEGLFYLENSGIRAGLAKAIEMATIKCNHQAISNSKPTK